MLGIIRPSSSNWTSTLHMVPKKTPGDWRPLQRLSRTLPFLTVTDSDFSASLHFLLVHAFHQNPVESSDVHKIAVTTPFGLFNFIRMPFGPRNAAQTFQRFIDQTLLLLRIHRRPPHRQHDTPSPSTAIMGARLFQASVSWGSLSN